MAKDTCSVAGCDRDTRARSMCYRHYQQWKRARDGSPCSVEGCARSSSARGWCDMHWKRWQKNGNPNDPGGRDFPMTEERFWSKVEKSDSCWRWTGALFTDTGYGAFRFEDGSTGLAHRFSFALANGGPIPSTDDDGEPMHVDHVCRVRACVRPEHLELVTAAENFRRGRLAADGVYDMADFLTPGSAS